MHTFDEQSLRHALHGCRIDSLDTELLDIARIRDLRQDGTRLQLHLVTPFPAQGLHAEISVLVARALAAFEMTAELRLSCEIAAGPRRAGVAGMEGVKNVIAVASGKGGVGKSTTAVNLALALKEEGARVGLLDADIYGPSQQIMLGIPEHQRPETTPDRFLLPIEAHGLQTMSMGFLVTADTAMVWRGPMASGALQQMLTQTRWQDLDYLVVDMPPGTGDIQLTLSQRVAVSGAIIVTTPQDIALLDCRKGIEMFRKVDIPVLGVVENMAVHICSRCGHAEHLFGAGGGERIASEYGVALLGSLPLDIGIREQADGGMPSVAADPDGPVSAIYRTVARRAGLELARRNAGGGGVIPTISISND
jgi:ATP-binding protein involved in chromosome partitioning